MEKKKIDINKIKAGDVIAVLSKEDSDFIKMYNAERRIVSNLTRTLLNGLIKDEIKMNALWEKYVSLDDTLLICCKDNLTIGISINDKEIVVTEKHKDW